MTWWQEVMMWRYLHRHLTEWYILASSPYYQWCDLCLQAPWSLSPWCLAVCRWWPSLLASSSPSSAWCCLCTEHCSSSPQPLPQPHLLPPAQNLEVMRGWRKCRNKWSKTSMNQRTITMMFVNKPTAIIVKIKSSDDSSSYFSIKDHLLMMFLLWKLFSCVNILKVWHKTYLHY